MNRIVTIIRFLSRIAGAAALALGLAFWTGHAGGLAMVHMLAGSALIICLWSLAIMALIRGRRRLLSAFAIAWGVLVPVFGILQYQLLLGSLHWLIRLTHLLMGVSVVMVVERIAVPERPAP